MSVNVGSARIARSSLEPIWRLMMTDPALTEAAFAAATLEQDFVDALDGPVVQQPVQPEAVAVVVEKFGVGTVEGACGDAATVLEDVKNQINSFTTLPDAMNFLADNGFEMKSMSSLAVNDNFHHTILLARTIKY